MGLFVGDDDGLHLVGFAVDELLHCAEPAVVAGEDGLGCGLYFALAGGDGLPAGQHSITTIQALANDD